MSLHSLLECARRGGTPVIDGDDVTFLWEGDEPPALVGDFNRWDVHAAAPWTPAGLGLWRQTLAFPPDAYIEYALLAGESDDSRVPDPLNPRSTPNGIGHTNHYFYMPQGAPTALATRMRGVPHGLVTRHVLSTHHLANRPHTAWLYRPPVAGPVPLIVVFDGRDYLNRAHLPDIVDNLIAQGRMGGVALALVDNGGPARSVEYMANEAMVGFVMETLLPLAQRELDLLDPGQTGPVFGVLGASLGGLMALYLGLRMPAVFGRVLSQSGAFKFDDHEMVVFDLVRHGPRRISKLWLDCGAYEWLLPGNRDMHTLLQARGYDVTYREYPGGHNYPAWRDDLPRGLEALYRPGA